MPTINEPQLYVPKSVEDALAALDDSGTRVIAGATWILRSTLRREAFGPRYVAIGEIPELKAIDVREDAVRIGAAATHTEIADRLQGFADLKSIRDAAAKSANPAIRGVATIGGNLCAFDFPAPDLTTALLSLSAEIELTIDRRPVRISIERFLQIRSELPAASLLRAVHIERTVRHTAHVRLPLRVAGDYPVAIVSLSVSPADAKVRSVVAAIGSVENTPSRWTMVEQYFLENPLDNEVAKTVALGCVDQFNGRDSAEAPGWYRTSVLPVLLQRAVIDIENQRQTNC